MNEIDESLRSLSDAIGAVGLAVGKFADALISVCTNVLSNLAKHLKKEKDFQEKQRRSTRS